jgi:hypothetical protein
MLSRFVKVEQWIARDIRPRNLKTFDRQYVCGSVVSFDCNELRCTGFDSLLQNLFEFNLSFVRDFLISHP